MRVIQFSVVATMPKTVFSGRDHLDYALADAALHFNCGEKRHVELFLLLGLDIGQHSAKFYEISAILVASLQVLEKVLKKKKIQTDKEN